MVAEPEPLMTFLWLASGPISGELTNLGWHPTS